MLLQLLVVDFIYNFFFLEGALVKVRIGDIKAVDLLSTVVLCILVSNEVIHLAKDCRTF